MIAHKTALILAFVALAPVSASAEITKVEAASSKAADLQLIGPSPLSLTCWQEGRKIIDEGQLSALNSGSLTGPPVLSFRQADDPRGRVLLLSIADTICMMKSEDASPE